MEKVRATIKIVAIDSTESQSIQVNQKKCHLVVEKGPSFVCVRNYLCVEKSFISSNYCDDDFWFVVEHSVRGIREHGCFLSFYRVRSTNSIKNIFIAVAAFFMLSFRCVLLRARFSIQTVRHCSQQKDNLNAYEWQILCRLYCDESFGK